MPCCGGKKAGESIGVVRFILGLILLAATHTFLLVWLALWAIFIPRYRKIFSSYLFFTRRVLRSAWKKEGINIS